MSEDEDAEREALDQDAAEREDFMARFPPSAFVDVARALKWPADIGNLVRLGRALRPRFYTFHESCSKRRLSPSAAAEQLRQLRDAANLLTSRDALLWMPSDLICQPNGEQFFAAARRLAMHWNAQLGRSSSRAGRRSHTAFRELIVDLIRVYARLTSRRPIKPWVRRSNPRRGTAAGYGGDFNEFAVAIWRCVFQYIPEARPAIPGSERAVAEALRNHWAQATNRRGEN
jgi:hypothetical protein